VEIRASCLVEAMRATRTSPLEEAPSVPFANKVIERVLETMGCVVLNRPWTLGVLAGVAAWAILRREAGALAVVKAEVAAELLRKAWDNNHTTA
jgi:hypothetical protein